MHNCLAFRRQGIAVLILTALLAFFLVLFLGNTSGIRIAEASEQEEVAVQCTTPESGEVAPTSGDTEATGDQYGQSSGQESQTNADNNADNDRVSA